MMTDRFDLEQKILKMFDVVADIRLVNDFVGDDRFEALAKVWELKIEDMWSTFEDMVRSERDNKEVREGWHQEWVPDTENPWREETKDGNVE